MHPCTLGNRLLIAAIALCLIALTAPIVFAQEARPTPQATPLPAPSPSLALAAYAGRYADPFYGEMDVTLTDGKLRLSIGKGETRSADLEHWHHETFQTKWHRRWLGDGLVSFQLNPVSGEVEAITIDGAQLRRVARAN